MIEAMIAQLRSLDWLSVEMLFQVFLEEGVEPRVGVLRQDEPGTADEQAQ
jgi:hypothetical protein